MASQESGEQSLNYSNRFGHVPFALSLFIFLLLSLVYSLILPLGEAADEAEHFALIRFIAEKHRPPLTLAEQHSISVKGDASPVYHTIVALLTQHGDVSDLPDLPDPRHRLERAIPYDRLPIKGLYHTEDEAFPFRGIVLAWHLARLVSIPLAAVVIIAVYLTVLAIYPGRVYLALAAAGFAAFIPRFVINSAIVSNDNLVIPLIAFALYYLVRLIHGDEQRRTFIILGVLMGLAAMTKYHSLVLLPEMTGVLLILAWRNQWGWRRLLHRWALTILAFLLVSGGWFAFLLIRFNQVADLGWVRGLVAALGDPVITTGVGRALNLQAEVELGYEAELGRFQWIDLLFRTFWFRYGRGHVIDTPIVNWLLRLITLIALFGLGYGLSPHWRRLKRHLHPSSGWRLDMALLACHFFIYLSLVAARYVSLPTRETAQGRHLYPALTAIAFFFILGLSQIPPAFNRLSPRFQERLNYDTGLALGVNMVSIGFALLALPLFIIPVYYPYLPIRSIKPDQAPIQSRLELSFAEGLNFEGYTLPPSEIRAGEALPLTLYWSATARQERDYLVELCLQDRAGEPVICRLGHPAMGRYPMRAWEPGYLIRDEVYLPTPYCLPPDDYELSLSVLPLRLDTAVTAVAESEKIREPLSLGWVTLSGPQLTQRADFELWLGDEHYRSDQIKLKQIRQTLTLLTYQPAAVPDTSAAEAGKAQLLSAPSNAESGAGWQPVAPEIMYRCPGGRVVSASNFIVGPNLEPDAYHLMVNHQIKSEPTVLVQTHPRDFNPPAHISTRLNALFGGQVELVGYDLDRSPYRPGDTIEIEVDWRSLRIMPDRYVGSFHLLDHTFKMWGQIDHILGNDYEYPNVLWVPGEIVNQTYALPTGQRTPPGLYTIEFGVYNSASENFVFLPVTTRANPEPVKQLHLGQIRIMDPAQTAPPTYRRQVTLGNQIQLLGYDLAANRLTGQEPLRFALHWLAINRPATDYTVFTQLVGPDGLVWGQQDNQPQAGRYPTTAWTLHDKVVDRYELTLREGAPPGEYRLLVGMYDLATGERLPAITADGDHFPDHAVTLTTLTVE